VGERNNDMATIAEIIAAKKKAAAAALPGKPSAGVVLTDRPSPDETARSLPAENRSLSRTAGEALPMLPVGASAEVATWHQAMNSFETDLCLMRDPVDPETCWLAARPTREGLQPLLLHRLPWLLWEHPAALSDQPF